MTAGAVIPAGRKKGGADQSRRQFVASPTSESDGRVIYMVYFLLDIIPLLRFISYYYFYFPKEALSTQPGSTHKSQSEIMFPLRISPMSRLALLQSLKEEFLGTRR